MRRIREVLRVHAALGDNLSVISASVGLARSTVRAYLQRAAAAKIDARAAEGLSEEALEAALFPAVPVGEGKRPTPDWAMIDQELRQHKHVTRKLLWLEYKAAHSEGYEFSQFNLLLSRWQKSSGRGMSMHQVHRAGESVQVDYAGDTVTVMDRGVARQAQLFIACLPCSGLIYAEATWTQGLLDWLASHIRLFAFLAGVTATVIVDNLKVGVTRPSFYEPIINASYAALIKHYGSTVLPARVRRPKDKPAAENGVIQAYRWLLAPLRHHQFFSLAELNQKLAQLVAELNDKPMASPREGSRRSLFETIERAALKPLPTEPYVLGEWTIGRTVNVDYHIALAGNFYSVPYRLVRKLVDAFVTPTSVQIFHRGERVGSHVRATGRNCWVTAAEHMPPAHSAIAKQTPDWIRAEAAKIGVASAAYVERLLTGRDHIQQGVRSCLGILRLAKQHPVERLEAACRRALAAGAHSSGYAEQLLKSGRPIPEPLRDDGPGLHKNLRGAGYYH
jgi:transposase